MFPVSLALALAVAAEPSGLTLFAGQKWYEDAKPAEALFVGTLELNPGSGRAGAVQRFNAFRLTWIDGAGKPGGRDLYLPDKAHFLAEHLGMEIRLVGKAVDVETDGRTVREIWPARLELTKATPPQPVVPEARDGILARCFWHPGVGLQRGPRLFVYRNGEALVEPMKISGKEAAITATAVLAWKMGLETINWKTHLAICVSLGLSSQSLTVSRARVEEGVLILTYKKGKPGEGLNVAAETILVERFDGEVRLEQDK